MRWKWGSFPARLGREKSVDYYTVKKVVSTLDSKKQVSSQFAASIKILAVVYQGASGYFCICHAPFWWEPCHPQSTFFESLIVTSRPQDLIQTGCGNEIFMLLGFLKASFPRVEHRLDPLTALQQWNDSE